MRTPGCCVENLLVPYPAQVCAIYLKIKMKSNLLSYQLTLSAKTTLHKLISTLNFPDSKMGWCSEKGFMIPPVCAMIYSFQENNVLEISSRTEYTRNELLIVLRLKN